MIVTMKVKTKAQN